MLSLLRKEVQVHTWNNLMVGGTAMFFIVFKIGLGLK